MNSRERFLKTINGEIPDRVPVTLFMLDHGHFINQYDPSVDQWDFPALQRKVIDAQRELGADVFVRMLFDINDPLHVHMGGVDFTNQTDNWEITTTEYQKGDTKILSSKIRTPEGTLEQEFSIYQLRPGTLMFGCTKKPVQDEKDLDLLIKYEPRMNPSFKEAAKKKVKALKDYLGDDGILGVWAPHGPFNNASLLIDHEELYALFLTDFDYYDKLMRYAQDRILDYTQAMIDAQPDVLCVGGNVPGGFLGKATYDKYILPYEREYITFCQKEGVPAMYHNCGEIMNLVESYVDLGAKIVEPFSPAPLGDADLRKAKQLVDGRYVMVGGVDQVNGIQNGSLSNIVETTKRTVETGKVGGKFILQSADFLEYNTPIKNIEAFVKTGIEFGGY